MGTPDFAVPTLERLAESGHELASVVTRPDRASGRGLKVKAPPVKEVAERLGIQVLQPESLQDKAFLGALRALAADVFVVVAFLILPRPVLRIPGWGSLNLHPSLLPKYRGAAPIQWAVIRGEQETGISIFRLNPRVDAGDVVVQQRVPIGSGETYGELYDRLRGLGAEVMLEALDGLERGDVVPVAQPEEGATRAPKLTRTDAEIAWTADAESIRNLVRGTNPVPGAFTFLRGKAMKVHRAETVPGQGRPGEVIAADAQRGLVVATGSGGLSLAEVQLEGKRRMESAAFVLGRQVEVGESLG